MFGASGAFGHGDLDGIDHDGDGHFDLDDLIDHH